jgi:hypothetical protein
MVRVDVLCGETVKTEKMASDFFITHLSNSNLATIV